MHGDPRPQAPRCVLFVATCGREHTQCTQYAGVPVGVVPSSRWVSTNAGDTCHKIHLVLDVCSWVPGLGSQARPLARRVLHEIKVNRLPYVYPNHLITRRWDWQSQGGHGVAWRTQAPISLSHLPPTSPSHVMWCTQEVG